MQIWPQVKAANPHLSSVTEIGAVVGAMWRDLDPVEKQRYNDQFNKDKVTLIGFRRAVALFPIREKGNVGRCPAVPSLCSGHGRR